jgi:hypothetical protein
MIRNCDTCGEKYEAQRPQSRFCSTKCRVKNNGKPKPVDDWLRRRNFFVPDENDPIEILRARVRAKRNGDEQAYARAMARWEALPPSVTNPNPENW